jgi:hypothetical protein
VIIIAMPLSTISNRVSTSSTSASLMSTCSGLKKRSSYHIVTGQSSAPLSCLERSKRAKLDQTRRSCIAVYTSGPEVAAVRVRTIGEMLHDPTLSPEQFSRKMQIRTTPISLGTLSDITDGGDVANPSFLAKLSALLPKVDASQVEAFVLRLVRQESLVDESEFHRHKAMLQMLLAATCTITLLQRAVKAAADIGSSDVVSTVVRRLREVAPGVVAQVTSGIKKKLSRPSLALRLQDRLDEEEDARLAALEDEPDTEDEDFVVNDSDDDAASQDEEYEPPTSESSDDDDDDDEDNDESTATCDEE